MMNQEINIQNSKWGRPEWGEGACPRPEAATAQSGPADKIRVGAMTCGVWRVAWRSCSGGWRHPTPPISGAACARDAPSHLDLRHVLRPWDGRSSLPLSPPLHSRSPQSCQFSSPRRPTTLPGTSLTRPPTAAPQPPPSSPRSVRLGALSSRRPHRSCLPPFS
jgi:hypothetical protein